MTRMAEVQTPTIKATPPPVLSCPARGERQRLACVDLDRRAEFRAEHLDRPDPDRKADPHDDEPGGQVPPAEPPAALRAELAGEPQRPGKRDQPPDDEQAPGAPVAPSAPLPACHVAH